MKKYEMQNRHLNIFVNRSFRCMASLAIVASLADCGGGKSTNSANVSAIPTSTVSTATCGGITTASLNIPGLTVTSAVLNPAAASTIGAANGYPAHCQVLGNFNSRTGIDGNPYAIGVDIRLPASGWNGKFFYSGDGGMDGAFGAPLGSLGNGATTNALSLGYAVASSNGGHVDPTGIDGAFGFDPQARIDYAYNALGTTIVNAKSIIKTVYGAAPSRSYYVGCSKGGQSGFMAATRFADQFDGIVAGDPGFNLPKAAVEEIYDNQQFTAVNGSVTSAFSSQDLALVSSRILAKCDALDGATDGMVNNLPACKAAFNLATDVPQCAAGKTPDGTCLSTAQTTALQAVFSGSRDAAGNLLYADWPWDPGITGSMPGSGWTFWKFTLNPLLGSIAMGNVFSVPPTAVNPANATPFSQSFDMNQAYDFIYGSNATFTNSPMSIMSPPDPYHLTTLASKGKMIVYHGTADPVFSVNDTINWYGNLLATDPNAGNYARLFLVPGMNHCGGGTATDNVGAFTSLVNWVENGVAPDSIVASVAAGNTDVPASWSASRTRPLCPYPKQATLMPGATNLESASSFSCQ